MMHDPAMQHMMVFWGGLLGLGIVFFVLSHLLFVVPLVAIGIWLHWRILERMGYPGHWSLLLLLFLLPWLHVLVLLAYLAAIWLLAYSDWPRDRKALPPPAPVGEPPVGS